MAIERPWHRDRGRLVRAVRDRAVCVDPAKQPRQLAFDHVRARGRLGSDGPSRLRAARGSPGARKGRRVAAAKQPGRAARSISHAGFWLLTIGFFVCGFHVTFIGLHLPSYISDHAVALSFFGRPISAIELGGWAIGLVGLFNIVGTLLWGWTGGRHPRKDMLALLYALRALAFV